MGAHCSHELGDHSLAQQIREYSDIVLHRLHANDPNLTEVSMPNHDVGNTELEQAASALAATTHLRSIDLAFNNIGPHGAALLAAALRNSACGTSLLWELRLSGNPIGRDGCRALCDWLESCYDTCALKSLYLFQCDLDDECVLMLANTLQRQKSITALNLDMNRFSKKTAIMLAQMLRSNNSICRLTFTSSVDGCAYPEATMKDIDEALARNAVALEHRDHVEQVKAAKAQRRLEREEAEKKARDAALAEERERVEHELTALEELKRQEDDQVRALESKMAATLAKRNEKAAASQSQRQESLENAIRGAYEWRNKVTGNGTLQKEWRSGFTIMKTEPGAVGGAPVVSSEPPRRLRACWCDPQDATAPFAQTLHYHCKWEDLKQDVDSSSVKSPKKGTSGGAEGSGYTGCQSTGHICSSVGFYTKPRPDLSAPHFFASPHPGAAKTVDADRV
jgi:hypothetical protein